MERRNKPTNTSTSSSIVDFADGWPPSSMPPEANSPSPTVDFQVKVNIWLFIFWITKLQECHINRLIFLSRWCGIVTKKLIIRRNHIRIIRFSDFKRSAIGLGNVNEMENWDWLFDFVCELNDYVRLSWKFFESFFYNFQLMFQGKKTSLENSGVLSYYSWPPSSNPQPEPLVSGASTLPLPHAPVPSLAAGKQLPITSNNFLMPRGVNSWVVIFCLLFYSAWLSCLFLHFCIRFWIFQLQDRNTMCPLK